jgi:hypothetical protein
MIWLWLVQSNQIKSNQISSSASRALNYFGSRNLIDTMQQVHTCDDVCSKLRTSTIFSNEVLNSWLDDTPSFCTTYVQLSLNGSSLLFGRTIFALNVRTQRVHDRIQTYIAANITFLAKLVLVYDLRAVLGLHCCVAGAPMRWTQGKRRTRYPTSGWGS